MGNRVSRREEAVGLDLSIHGEAAYELFGPEAPAPVAHHAANNHPVGSAPKAAQVGPGGTR
jgi:hypothetical protein